MASYDMQIGNVNVIALSDMNCIHPTPLEEMWPDVPVEGWESYRRRYPDTFLGDRLKLEIGCYFIRSNNLNILVDTGYGPGPIDYIGGLRGQLMLDLASKGIDPVDIDVVFLSHLHLDHVGWNLVDKNGTLVPRFPNARYVAHQSDLDYFRRTDVQASARYYYMDETIEPLVEMGKLDLVQGDFELTSEVRVIHTPGHTPGHMSVVVSSKSKQVLIEGDVFIHPAQITEEDWNSLFDVDFDVSSVTRKKILDFVEENGVTLVACHFPAPGYGQIVRENGKRYWAPASFDD